MKRRRLSKRMTRCLISRRDSSFSQRAWGASSPAQAKPVAFAVHLPVATPFL